ncbi:TetR/AcrR family transcriptional regulator [Amycolatopsis jiangsuensis]|uniref:AcrR family transcriptional regulator n=1 Tax=Amycolatopsis jiangsuensis TaxID=1181879 RepID=A0A840IV28_9PSEU|nr:TetR/AcrR family transcriptional regulator [Amycolatopsis jiangsuensis]MBB4686571.1 AcrR family transcriptional regulator [Amycolatopsis jiangsuensis]
MPRGVDLVRQRLKDAAVELFLDNGFDETTAESIAARAGVTERTYFRHFADKREVLFDEEGEFGERIAAAIAAVPEGVEPLPALHAAFHDVVPLLVAGRPQTEPRMRVIATHPALQERALAKTAALVTCCFEALRARGVDDRTAKLCAEVGWHAFGIATDRWREDSDVELADVLDEVFENLRAVVGALG